MAQLVQKILLPDETLEIPVGLAPLAWTRDYPTHVRIEGEISPEVLRKLVEYVESTGLWRWDPQMRRFYPVA